MTDLTLLSEAQMRRIEPYFPLSHGISRVDDRRVMSGIVFVIRNGLCWRDAPPGYGRTRRSTITLSSGAAWGCSTASSAACRRKVVRPTSSWSTRPISRHTAPRPACSKRGCSQTYRAHEGRLEQRAARGLRRARSGPASCCSPRARSATTRVQLRCCASCPTRPCSSPTAATTLTGSARRCARLAPAAVSQGAPPIDADPARQAALPPAPQGRDYVRQAQGMATHRHTLRSLRSHLHVRHRTRRQSPVLATSQ